MSDDAKPWIVLGLGLAYFVLVMLPIILMDAGVIR